jgi:hypothetical protein
MDGDNRICVRFAEEMLQLLEFAVVRSCAGCSAKLETAAKGGGCNDLALLPVFKREDEDGFCRIIEMKRILRRELEKISPTWTTETQFADFEWRF